MDTIIFKVTGIMHRPKKIIKMIADEIDMDDVLDLECDSENEYDPYAVKVFYTDEWIGYVERDYSKDVTELILSEADIECKVITCLPEWDFEENSSGREVEVITDIDLLAEITIR